jgi:signal transduction histidine kinase
MAKTIRVLFIEDSEDDVLLEMNELSSTGHEIIYKRVDTAEEFNKALQEQTWDCIISDYSMPHFTGLEALAELKNSGKDIPFILVSGVIGEETAVEAMKAGSYDYIMKSQLQRLLPAVEREMREAKVRKQKQIVVKALRESERNLKQQIKDYQTLNTEYLALNEELKKSLEHIKKINEDLITAKNKAEESDRLKSAFLSTMNHELRTPLNHILGFSELILSGVNPEITKDYVQKIEASGKALLSIIEDIFDLALVEQSEIKVRKKSFALMDLFDENKLVFNEILRSSGKDEHIRLHFLPDNNFLKNYIISDRNKINQVLINLFKNAIKFTSNGFIEFGFSVPENNRISFYIKDSGIGIPKDKQAIIFDWFRQGDDTHSRQYSGVGIGLSLAKKISQVLNGDLTVESEPEKGSTFTFTVPVEMIESEATAPSETAPPPQYFELDLNKKTILIVEDDPLSRSLIRSYLKKTHAITLEADEGSEAIRKWHGNPSIDMILMDLKMPGMDGFVATHIIKSEKPELPIVALTAYSSAEDKAKALEAGCNSVITKPVERYTLLKEISKTLKMNLS